MNLYLFTPHRELLHKNVHIIPYKIKFGITTLNPTPGITN